MRFLLLLTLMFSGVLYAADVKDTAKYFCNNNEECINIISLELDSMYYQGLNEENDVRMGTLINRKARSYNSYCEHSPNKKLCEEYKKQLILRYITGLLNR